MYPLILIVCNTNQIDKTVKTICLKLSRKAQKQRNKILTIYSLLTYTTMYWFYFYNSSVFSALGNIIYMTF